MICGLYLPIFAKQASNQATRILQAREDKMETILFWILFISS